MRFYYPICLYIVSLTLAMPMFAQESNHEMNNWTLRTRIILSGSSDKSEPEGYHVYSALAVEPSIARKFSKHFSLELNLRTESHEVDLEEAGLNEPTPLGSIELIPLNLILQFRTPANGNMHLYFGAGINYTFFWEKSGTLNSTDLTPGLGPSLQLGSDIDLSSNISLNIQVGWNALSTNIEDKGIKIASLDIDPLALGVGISYHL